MKQSEEFKISSAMDVTLYIYIYIYRQEHWD
jgi:hypothetical protein